MKTFFVPTRDTYGFPFRENKIKERKSFPFRENKMKERKSFLFKENKMKQRKSMSKGEDNEELCED